jgi:recombination protein RecT
MANLGKTESGALAKPQVTLTALLNNTDVRGRFEGMLGKRAAGFISSILNTTNSSNQLKDISAKNPESILRSAAVAAALDLPIDRNLGFAWIVPYGSEAQFQLGYKGYIQLALRTGQYRKITAVPVHANQFKSWNPLTETLDADFSIEGAGEVVGFAVYFELINGYTKTTFFTKAWLIAHGKKYSKTFGNGPWTTHQEEMCLKTAIKMTLSKWGILSIEMQTALKADQAVIKSDDPDAPDAFAYPDNPERDVIDVPATEVRDTQGA